MSRRCKPGRRALVISGRNRGRVVLVVRHYFGESIDDATWSDPIYPWVVTSLGTPLSWSRVDGSERGTAMTIVLDDSELQLLDDDDDGLTRSTEKDKPIGKVVVAGPEKSSHFSLT